MIGAMIGDVIGSNYENHNTKTIDFPFLDRFSHFTDHTVLTLASISGGIAQAFYKQIPPGLVSQVQLRLDANMRQVIRAFEQQFNINHGVE